MFKDKDPRAGLFAATTTLAATGLIATEQLALFYEEPPQETGDGSRTWYIRGCNFVLEYSETSAGTTFERMAQPDEYVLYLAETAHGAIIEWNNEKVEIPGGSVAFVPPGNSRITLPSGGNPVRLFTVASKDLVAACINAGAYEVPRHHIPAYQPWPEPVNGWKIRHYSLDVPDTPGRFGRIFRCSTFMVNALPSHVGPRDTAKMSPHNHDDFEQCSLALYGTFAHHLRWPWTTDMNDWREDKTVEVRSPSALVIPPPVIHTSRASSAGHNDLVDIFCPPRMDFSQMPGWVLNESDYPLPEKGA